MLFNAQGGSISVGKALNHAPLAGRNKKLQSIAELKGQAKTSNATPEAIIQETTQRVYINYSAKMPSTLVMRQTIHHIHKREFPAEAASAIDLIIPDKFQGPPTREEKLPFG